MSDDLDQLLDVRLRELGRAAEELASPVGAAAARSRAARRHRRRAAYGGAVASVSVVTALLWGTQSVVRDAKPDVPASRTGLATAASVLPEPEQGGTLPRSALLVPSALPWYGMLTWHTVEIGAGDEIEPSSFAGCGVRWPGGPLSEVAAAYAGHRGAQAQHRIAEYADAAQAKSAAQKLEETLRGCGWRRAEGVAPDHSPQPDTYHEYEAVADGVRVRAAIVRRGDRAAVLVLEDGAGGSQGTDRAPGDH